MNSPADQPQVAASPTPEDDQFAGKSQAEIDELAFAEEYDRRYGTSEAEEEPEPSRDDPPAPTAEDPPPAEAKDTDSPPEGEQPQNVDPALPAWVEEIPDEAKAAFEKAGQELDQLRRQYNAVHNRLAPVQQENERLRQQLASSRPPAQGAPVADSAPPPEEVSLSDSPAFKEFAAAFPEEAKAMEATFGKQSQHLTHLHQQLGQVSQGLQEVQQSSLDQQRQQALGQLATAHPDWATVRPSEDFNQWLSYQPPSVARLADSKDPGECIWILDRYKADVSLVDQINNIADPTAQSPQEPSAAQQTRNRRRLLRSVPSLDPQSGDVGPPAGAPTELMTDEQIWEQEVERRLRSQREANR